MKKSVRKLTLAALVVVASLAHPVRGFAFTIEKIADCSDVPGGELGCSIVAIRIDAGVVAFLARGHNNSTEQVIRYRDGQLEIVVDATTPIPGFGQTFGDGTIFLSDIAMNSAGIAFSWVTYGGGFPQGVYGESDSSLYVIADPSTPVPGGTGNFDSATPETPALDGAGGVAFVAYWTTDPGQTVHAGLWRTTGGTTELVAEIGTPIPGRSETFVNFGALSLDQGRLAFRSSDSSSGIPYGVYSDVGGSLHVVADHYTPVPGGTGNFAQVGTSSGPSISGNQVVFDGTDAANNAGIYLDSGGALEVVADRNTPVPGGTGNFTAAYFASLDAGAVMFSGFSAAPGNGLYTTYGGTLRKVVDSSDAAFLGQSFAGRSNGNQIAFVAVKPYSNPLEQEVYIATLTDFCGNRVVDADEECDDGNASDNDTCTNACTLASCGDEIVQTGVEACDDGNLIASDHCKNDCSLNSCGDGVLCTDVATCTSGPAGSTEACDDGIANSDTVSDACRTDCSNAACGDDTVDFLEECDDGDVDSNDGCSAACVFDCESEPRDDCRVAGVSVLLVKDSPDNRKDAVKWKWSRGAETIAAQLSDPTDLGRFNLCLYADGTSLRSEMLLPAQGGWTSNDEKGYSYADVEAEVGGIVSLKLRAGSEGRAGILSKAKGENLPDNLLPATSYIVQLVDAQGGTCWSSGFTSGGGTAGRFKGKTIQ